MLPDQMGRGFRGATTPRYPRPGLGKRFEEPEAHAAAFRNSALVERSLREHPANQGEASMYIGIGTILLIILIVVLIVWVF
jgi:hypothetical protein